MSKVKFRQIDPTEAFINGAKTGDGAGQGTLPKSSLAPVIHLPQIPPGLNSRVQKQVNIVMPETDHYELKELVRQMPDMSMQRFILEAIAEKVERVIAGQGASPE